MADAPDVEPEVEFFWNGDIIRSGDILRVALILGEERVTFLRVHDGSAGERAFLERWAKAIIDRDVLEASDGCTE